MLFENKLDLVLQEIMTRWDVPGLAVGIAAGGKIAYAKGFGVQNLEARAPVTLDTVFCVQSISKCFVATAVMQLVERGALDLDAPLVQVLPYFEMGDDRYRQITLRMALSHTSGMPDIDELDYIDWVAHPEGDGSSAERFVRSLKAKNLTANPGEHFSYSNIAYNVLGDVLAKVSFKPFETVMREQILVPCGMQNSTFLPSEIPPDRLAWPHLRSPEMKASPIYPYQRADAPASFLHTTVVDLCHWSIASLNQGTYLGQRLLSPSSYTQMWTPVAKRGDPPSMFEAMGLGWSLGQYKGLKTVCHGGGGFGWTAFLLLLPEKNSAVVVLSNEESSAHIRALRAAADAVIGQVPQANAVSWMVPISRALAAGGIEAAYQCYAEIKDRQEDFYFNEDDLISLSLQLFSAGKVDFAIAILGLNIHVYPESIESYLQQAKLYQKMGLSAPARENLLKAISIEPGNTAVSKLLSSLC